MPNVIYHIKIKYTKALDRKYKERNGYVNCGLKINIAIIFIIT